MRTAAEGRERAAALQRDGLLRHGPARVEVEQGQRDDGRVQADNQYACRECEGVRFVERRGGFEPEFGGLRGGDERVEGDDRHVEPDGPAGDLAADAAEADDAEGLAGELGADELAALPLALMHTGIRRRNHPG